VTKFPPLFARKV